MRFPIPSSVTYAFAEGSFGLRFPFGLRFVVFFVVGGRKNQDFTPLTEYPPGGVLRNDYFANGRGLGHAPGLLQIWALSGVPRALVCSVRAAVGRGAADRASVSFRGIPEGPAAGPSATLCVCTGSSSRPAAAEAHFRSVGASALPGVWPPGRVRGAASCWIGALLWPTFDLVGILGVEGKEKREGPSGEDRRRRFILSCCTSQSSKDPLI